MPDVYFTGDHGIPTTEFSIGRGVLEPQRGLWSHSSDDDERRMHARTVSLSESHDYTPDERQALTTLKAFQSNVRKLDNELQDLIASVSPLGASVAVHSSALHMRQHLSATLTAMFRNAQQRFPRHGLFRDAKLDHNALRNMRLPFNVSLPPYPAPNGRLELHIELMNLAERIDIFFGCLQEFTGHVDGLITDTVTLIHEDLKYIAQRVEEAGKQNANVTLACQIFAHDVTPDIGSRLVELTNAISSVKHSSLPSLKFTHEHAVSNFNSMATVATFFSAVVATALQFPHEPHSSLLEALTSGFWLTSLVLSISSAFHSVWAASWQQAVYRFPRPRVPSFVQIWMTHAPICLLGASVLVFCAGLVCFVISSQPKGVILAVTVTLLCCTAGFSVCTAWFLLEITAYFRYQVHTREVTAQTSNNSHATIQGEIRTDLWQFPGLKWLSQPSPQIRTDELENQLPAARTTPAPALSRRVSQDSEFISHFRKLGQRVVELIRLGKRQQEYFVRDARPIDLSIEHQVSHSSSSIFYHSGNNKRRLVHAVREIRRVPAHQSPVKKICFSPDGLSLATAGSWDRKTHAFSLSLLNMTDSTISKNSASQIVWAPNKSLIAVRRGSRIRVYVPYQEETLSLRLFSNPRKCALLLRPCRVESISWYPNSEALLSIEGNEALKISLDGTVLERHPVDNMNLHAGVVLRNQHLILLASASKTRMPSTAHPQRYIIAYNPALTYSPAKPIIVPVAHDAIDIDLTTDQQMALISYKHKAPPQLWHLGYAGNGMRLTLIRSFGSAYEEFAGPCALTGKNDEFVVGANKNGDVYIWDRAVGTLLRHIKPSAESHDDSTAISCIAGSRFHDSCMFATGSTDGTVRLWQADANPGSMRTGQTMIVPLPQVQSPVDALGLSGVDQLPTTGRSDELPLPSSSTVFQRTVDVDDDQPILLASPRPAHKELLSIDSIRSNTP